MKTKLIKIEGVELVVMDYYRPPFTKLKDYKNCCGAGEGLGEKLVPDKILGLSISVVCHIHDFDFENSPPKWSAFHAASFRFVRNIYAIIRAKSNWGMGLLRTMIASVYFYSVDTKGAKIFERLKNSQGNQVT